MYRKENLRILRRYLGQTQKEFIEYFLKSEANEKPMSIATLSNLEAKGGKRLNEVIAAVSEKLSMDPMIFMMDSEEFAEQIDVLVPNNADTESIRKSAAKKSGINQLINQLTLYFAEQIFEKKLKKGDKIESDRELSAKLHVGRSAIREAMKVLDVLGMVDIHPGQGTYISSNEADFFIIPLSWSLFLNGNQTEEIIAVRNLIEVKAAELAAGCTEEECMNRLFDISHEMHRAYVEGNYKEFLEGDLKFHACIAQCSGNMVIYSMIQTINNLMRQVSKTGMIREEQLKDIYEEHQKVYGFIITHNAAEARKAMEEHLCKSKERYNYR